MNSEQIEKLLFSNPITFFESWDKKGINFESLSELNVPKLIVKKRFPELVKE